LRPVVLDASVAAKWFLPDENLAPQADRLLEEAISFFVPDLFWTEFANILWKASRTGRISQASAMQSLENALAQPLKTAPSLSLTKAALEIAAAFDRSVYDSLYLALAIESGTYLVTADERLFRAVGDTMPVRWLGAM
jgi:predicted nucleic acid-binding protein